MLALDGVRVLTVLTEATETVEELLFDLTTSGDEGDNDVVGGGRDSTVDVTISD